MSPKAGSGQSHGFDVVFIIEDMVLMIKITALNESDDDGVKLMTMTINMKKTIKLTPITSMIMLPASLTLSLPDPQEP